MLDICDLNGVPTIREASAAGRTLQGAGFEASAADVKAGNELSRIAVAPAREAE
jgi:hypothetical protein